MPTFLEKSFSNLLLKFPVVPDPSPDKIISLRYLSSLFLKEFYKKLKYIFAPGFEDFEFSPQLNINNFISKIKSFYQSKGTDE